ncbi:MAG: glycosyltransferase [Candidatus Staskawiczbacteria bacterium]|jgi:GT2 family glycosyltransferase
MSPNNKETKYGIIITFHNHVKDFMMPCLNSVLEYTIKPRLILVYDNESNDPDRFFLLKKFNNNPDICFIRVDNQLENDGLTGTWNQGIKKCFENGCDKVVLLNHDTIVDESWPIFLKSIKEGDCAYGPVSDNIGGFTRDQKRSKDYSLKNSETLKETIFLSGFCLGFDKNALESNKYNENDYFNPAYPFGYNEKEWENRFRKREGKLILVEGCFVHHKNDNAWTNIKLLRRHRKEPLPLSFSFYFRILIGKFGIVLHKYFPKIYAKLKPYFPTK